MAEKRPGTADIVMLGTFGLWTRGTLQARALPFARSLNRATGLRCAIVTTPWDDPTAAGTIECVNGVRIVNTRSHRPASSPLAAVEQLQWVRRLNPRLIHLMKPKGFGGLSAAWISMFRKPIPLIVDEDDWEGDGGWNDAAGYGLPSRRLFALQEVRLLRSAAHVTAASTLLAERSRRIRGDAGSRDVTFLPNGLDADWIERLGSARSIPSREATRSILLYSRFAEFSPGWLREFMTELSARLVAPVTLAVVGEPGGVDPSGRGMPNIRVLNHGYVERDCLPSLLGKATVAIYPYEDTLINRSKQSVKLLELMAAGCPIVASDVGDIRRIGDPGVELARSGGPAAFATSVAALIENRERRAELSAAARERIRAFTIERLTERLVAAYRAAGARI